MTDCNEISKGDTPKRMEFQVEIKIDDEDDRKRIVKFLRDNRELEKYSCSYWAKKLANIIEKG